jgi:hypothetical protein
MAANRPKSGSGAAGWIALALLGVVEVAVVAACAFALMRPAQAQIDERFPFLENRQRRNQQQPFGPQWGSPYGQERQAGESTRAPAPRRPDVAPTVNVVVFGDSMSEWLAYGLEDAFAETPEMGIQRKARPNAGLIRVEQRGESYDWPAAAREILNAEKPDFVVMMLGTADRRGIREAIRQQPARPPAGQKQDQAKQAAPAQTAQPGQPAQPAAEAPKPIDNEVPPADAAASEQPTIAAPEGAIAGTVVHEFRSERWGELYARRVDEMIGVLKARGVPVLWVGLPPIRGTRATSDMVYLNDIYRGRAEKAGIVYVDVWDGFVDDAGNYNNYGADFEGQTRRLRNGDGVHFTRPGARKLAHYSEREIRRLMQARATPLAAVTPQDPEPETDTKAPPTAAAPGLPPRPIASPVMSLTAPRGGGDTLLGGAPTRASGADSVVQRVLVRGEPIEAPAGRADDFAWPRRDIVTATGVLPPDPVEVTPVASTTTTPATTTAAAQQPPRPAQPRPPRPQRQESAGWQPWGGNPWGQQQRQDDRRGGFFGGWFGGNRW